MQALVPRVKGSENDPLGLGHFLLFILLDKWDAAVSLEGSLQHHI